MRSTLKPFGKNFQMSFKLRIHRLRSLLLSLGGFVLGAFLLYALRKQGSNRRTFLSHEPAFQEQQENLYFHQQKAGRFIRHISASDTRPTESTAIHESGSLSSDLPEHLQSMQTTTMFFPSIGIEEVLVTEDEALADSVDIEELNLLDRLSSFNQSCLPRFLVIGAQKAGTSSFHSHLKAGAHPHIKVPFEGKELNLFSDKLTTFEEVEEGLWSDKAPFLPPEMKGLQLEDLIYWYQQQFDGSGLELNQCDRRALRGEISPNYAVYPQAPERARALLPDAKIIFLLRNPIARAKSSFNMKWQVGVCGEDAWKSASCYIHLNETVEELRLDWEEKAKQSFKSEIELLTKCKSAHKSISPRRLFQCLQMDEMDSVQLYTYLEDQFHLGRGLYADQIMNWFHHFPPKQFLFLSSEAYEQDPAQALHQFLDFMTLDTRLLNSSALKEKYHVRHYVHDGDLGEVDVDLKHFFDYENEKLFNLLGRTGHSYAVPHLRHSFST